MMEKPDGTHDCGLCGAKHPYDTSIPSVAWNDVIRAQGLPEYLCATCILRAFARAGRSFTAELWGDGFEGLPIEVRINEQPARDMAAVCEQNNDLRGALSGILDLAHSALDEATGVR